MTIRAEFTGMLPAAIEKFEQLLSSFAGAAVVKGYNSAAGPDSFFYWGAACRMEAGNMAALKSAAQAIGITWLSDDGDMAYTNGLTIDDFKTYRVSGNLELMPEGEV